MEFVESVLKSDVLDGRTLMIIDGLMTKTDGKFTNLSPGDCILKTPAYYTSIKICKTKARRTGFDSSVRFDSILT